MWLLKLESILVATDLDEASVPALRTAARLAPLADASLHLLHVTSDPAPDADLRLGEHFRGVVPDPPELASVHVPAGAPAALIVEYAAGIEADAVILGPHRRASAPDAMGSTAMSVVRTAPCPCLVVARELRLPLERVVVPIDLSEATPGALSVALSWASALRPRGGRAELTALYVASDGTATDAAEAVRDEVARARERAGGAALVEIRESIATAADPAVEILRAAAAESVDLLVMGTQGAGKASAELGSVSAAVARGTPCPLLLVPPAVSESAGR